MRIVVKVDRVILDGLSGRVDTKRVGAAFEQELSRSLSTVSTEHWRGTSRDKIAANVALAGMNSADAIGRRLANAVHSAVSAIAPRRRGQLMEQTHGRPLR